MRNRTGTPLAVPLLAALWLTAGRCGASEAAGPGPGPGPGPVPRSGCDNGQLSLDRDLHADAAHWVCPGPPWPESTQEHPGQEADEDDAGGDDPQPARQVCMDESISYSHAVPSSGAYRPIRAESGEYLYCPPQRWLNNLHHGATVLLYHPCAAPRLRRLLSVLSRSCLPDHVLTPHPHLRRRAVGRSLAAQASLAALQVPVNVVSGTSGGKILVKFLTETNRPPVALVSWGRSLEVSTVASLDICDWLETATSQRNWFRASLQRRKYNLLMTWSAEHHGHARTSHTKESLRKCCEQIISPLLNGAMEAELPSTVKDKNKKRESKKRQRRVAIIRKRENVADRNMRTNISAHVFSFMTNQINKGSREASSLPQVHRQGLPTGPSASSRSNISEVALGPESSRSRASEAFSSKEEGTESVRDKDGEVMSSEVVDVRERELESRQRDRTPPTTQTESPSSRHQKPQKVDKLVDAGGCDSCTAGQQCSCHKTTSLKGLPRTPRTDEAVWAAGALGFLLVLLTLSVLHTRLYRHWRAPPSLYWHDPRQDYDSVADIIRRRLRIAKRRRKRGRRQECVLLPSSSSSDEHL